MNRNVIDELAFLKDLFSRKSLNPLSGHKKKAYKYSLCGIFINIIGGNHTTGDQKQNINMARYIRDSKLSKKEYESLEKLVCHNVESSFGRSVYKKPYNDDLINEIIAFTRERLDEIEEKGVSLFQAAKIINYNKYTGHLSLRDYHWVEFDLYQGIFPTIPQMIIFSDLKVHWNLYIELIGEFSEIAKDFVIHRERFDVITSPEYREFQHKLSAMQRNLVFLAVTFVEACLYDFFYNIKFSNFPEKDKISSRLGISKVNDKIIVEDIIFKLYPETKVELELLYNKYKEILYYRDRYVHASPFIDEANNTAHLQPLLVLRKSKVIVNCKH
ncbi:hypothetical protein [Cytobacillus praedii]|uniref:hypothetical protein n=1 Tax=Cytobacillus praedii TaxID=1742358 RepID=UPI003AF69915